MSNNFSSSKINIADTHVRAKPIIKVRINPRPKASDDHDLILQALARLSHNIVDLEGLISQLLKQQHYSEIRERERRW